MLAWLRLYTSILNDPDFMELPKELRYGYFAMLLVTGMNDMDGEVPTMKRAVLWSREDRPTVERWIRELIAAGFIDEAEDGTLHMHGWKRWQTPKDKTAAERMKRHRQKKGSCTSKENTDTDTEERREGTNVTATVPLRRTVTPVTRNADPPPPPPTFELEDEDPSGPLPPLSKIAEFAENLMGDPFWAQWADGQSRGGAPDHAIREALEETFNAGKITTAYAGRIMQRLRLEGYPARQKPIGKKILQLKGGSGSVNLPAVVPQDEIKRLEAELAKRPRLSRKEFEEKQRDA